MSQKKKKTKHYSPPKQQTTTKTHRDILVSSIRAPYRPRSSFKIKTPD